jgi:DNA polymerase-3 subunit epsilon
MILIFDTETTGINTRVDRLVTAFVGIVGPGGEVQQSHSWLANPGVEIPERAAAVHGITTEKAVAEGQNASDVVRDVVAILRDVLGQGLPLVVYNATFDLSLIHHEALRHGVDPLVDPQPIIDPLVIDRAVDRYRKGKRTLDTVSAHYGVINPAAHDAMGDAVTTGLVVQKMASQFPDAFSVDPLQLHEQQKVWAREWEENFYDFLEKNGKPRPQSRGQWPTGQ